MTCSGWKGVENTVKQTYISRENFKSKLEFKTDHILHFKESLNIPKGVIIIRNSMDRQHNDQKQKGKQRSTKHTHKTKYRITRNPLKERVSSSCSISGTRLAILVTNPVISHEWWKDWEVVTTGTFLCWWFVFFYFHYSMQVFIVVWVRFLF